MKVLFYKGQVVNVDDDCPSYKRMVTNGAEEIPIEIFGDNASIADNSNTTKVDGVWAFNPNYKKINEQEKLRLISSATAIVDNLIKYQITLRNESYGVAFAGIDALGKYAGTTHPHAGWCEAMIEWVVPSNGIWESLRSIQDDVLSGEIAQPTEEELINMLPKFEYKEV